jgi:hypothetical protein
MNYSQLNQRIRLVQAGDREAFASLVREGCGSLYLYAIVIREHKKEALQLVSATYIRAWNGIASLRVPDEFDLWLKGILWHEAAVSTTETTEGLRRRVQAKLDILMHQAFLQTENYWYLPVADRRRLVEDVMARVKAAPAR